MASIERMSKRNDPCEGVVSLGGEALVSMVSRRLDAPGLNVGGPFSLLQALVADWQQSGLSVLRYYAFQAVDCVDGRFIARHQMPDCTVHELMLFDPTLPFKH